MKQYLLIISLLLFGALILNGCSDKIKGPERENVAPEVHFVNIPVEGAKFSADMTLYWYGMDIDGFITHFRYVVVRSDVIDSVYSGWQNYFLMVPDENIPWNVLEVELNDPQTNDMIKMSADVSDPVRKYVESYVFLQAIDNLGAESNIIFRQFQKNNHFPNTSISARGINDPYVNTVSGGGVLRGVSIGWSGDDPIDYPRNPPPFEFQWKLIGPLDTLGYAEIMDSANFIIEDIFLDRYGDKYRPGDSLPIPQMPDTTIDTLVIPPDTTITVDTAWIYVDDEGRGSPYGSWLEQLNLDSLESPTFQHLNQRVDSSYDPLTGESWVYDLNTDIYNVYRNKTIDTTSEYYFLFWCQSRDDSKVPDPVPAFQWTSVIEPKFEREVIIIDATNYSKSGSNFWNWPVFPQKVATGGIDYPGTTRPIVKDVLGGMVNNWADLRGLGSDVFDTENILPPDTIDQAICPSRFIKYTKYHATQDYYPITKLNSCEQAGISPVKLRDILKHKTIILVKDMPGGQLLMDNSVMLSIIDGLNAGMSCWSMVRAPFPNFILDTLSQGLYQDVPTTYQIYFGVQNLWHTCWMGQIMYTDVSTPLGIRYGTRIEDFIGAGVPWEFSDYDPENYPDLVVDETLLEDRYLWVPGPPGFNIYDYRCNTTGEILVGALPEVGFVEKHPYAEAVYLYRSIYGDSQLGVTRDCNRWVGRFADYNGTVVAVRFNSGLFRTSHFSFSLLPFEETTAQKTFNSMMDWLSVQPFIQTGKMAPDAPINRVDIEEIRRLTDDLHELKAQGLLRSYETTD